jgi:hypothetical protein
MLARQTPGLVLLSVRLPPDLNGLTDYANRLDLSRREH